MDEGDVMKPIGLPMLALLAAGMLAGCAGINALTTQGGAPQTTGRGMRGNFSSADFQGMMQNLTAACQGMSAGDSCYLQTSRGSINGTCQMRNQTLMCSMGNRGYGGYNRSYNSS